MSPSPLAWALHSPARFVAVLITGCAAAALFVSIAWNGSGPGPREEAGDAHHVTVGQSVPAPSATPERRPAEEAAPLGPDARRTVARFLKSYLAPTSSQELNNLRPLCTASLWAGLRVAAPANMPRGPVTRIETTAAGAFAATYVARLPQTSLRIDVVKEPDGPRIASVEPEKP